MREALCRLLLVVIFFSCIRIGIAKTEDEIYSSPEVAALFYELLNDSGFGNKSTEYSAWIIRKENRYHFHKWPVDNTKNEQTWKGAIPYAAVAIAHTHPRIKNPEPSAQDVSIARKVMMPIYTISRHGIWKLSPDGRITQIKSSLWHKR